MDNPVQVKLDEGFGIGYTKALHEAPSERQSLVDLIEYKTYRGS